MNHYSWVVNMISVAGLVESVFHQISIRNSKSYIASYQIGYFNTIAMWKKLFKTI